jgi:integrase/recombinase XerD
MNDWIERFMEYIAVERGLSANTLESYQRDLTAFTTYLSTTSNSTVRDVKHAHVAAYLGHLRALGRANSTVSRNLASIRSLYHFSWLRILRYI